MLEPFVLFLPDPDVTELTYTSYSNGYAQRPDTSYWGFKVHVFPPGTRVFGVLGLGEIENVAAKFGQNTL